MQKRKPKIFLLFLTLIIIFAMAGIFKNNIKQGLFFILSPAQKFTWRIGDSIAQFFKTPFLIQTLKKENEALSQKNIDLTEENISLTNIKQENDVLRKALKISEEKGFDLEMADVLQKEENTDIIVISKGTNSGIFKDMAVITKEAVLAGKILEAFPDYCNVLLISAIKNKFNIEIHKNEAIITGIAQGNDDFKMSFDYIPKDAEISQGDIILTASLSEEYPAGLLVGEIQEVKKDATEPYQKGAIKPFFSRFELKNILIIKNTQVISF